MGRLMGQNVSILSDFENKKIEGMPKIGFLLPPLNPTNWYVRDGSGMSRGRWLRHNRS